jgi:hypothetical protein
VSTYKPTAVTLVPGVTPVEGYGGALFRIEPPMPLEDGRLAHYVINSWGLETILGDENYNVFPADETGRVLDWAGLVDDSGPPWCSDLLTL